jgi:hypothetical protein
MSESVRAQQRRKNNMKVRGHLYFFLENKKQKKIEMKISECPGGVASAH